MSKEVHEEWLVEAAAEVISDEGLKARLWELSQGETIELAASSYQGSSTIYKYNLNICVTRGPLDGDWLKREFKSNELCLHFFAKEHPSVCHGWMLDEDDKSI